MRDHRGGKELYWTAKRNVDQNPSHELVRVLRAWGIALGFRRKRKRSRDTELDAAERLCGRPFPSDFRALYREMDGAELLGGNLQLLPLRQSGDDIGVVGASERLSEWEWPIPDEVLVFGSTGTGEQLGLWVPRGAPGDSPTPVIEIGQIFEDGSFAIAGTDLIHFLKTYTALYMLIDHDPQEIPHDAFDVLGLPEELRRCDPDDRTVWAIYEWGDPSLPFKPPDAYEQSLTAQELRKWVAGDLPRLSRQA